jgi:hypothetical protein
MFANVIIPDFGSFNWIIMTAKINLLTVVGCDCSPFTPARTHTEVSRSISGTFVTVLSLHKGTGETTILRAISLTVVDPIQSQGIIVIHTLGPCLKHLEFVPRIADVEFSWVMFVPGVQVSAMH